MSKKYVYNLETGKIELHFTKNEYQALTEDQKKELKSNYLWSRTAQAWVSRSKNNHYWAIKTAQKLGFTKEERQGKKLSFAEELERKAKKAERRAEKYIQYAENAEKRANQLQSELEHYRGDIAFFTQPVITGHSGSQSFAKRRDKILNRYKKGFDEYRKSEYYKNKAITAQKTANMKQLKNRTYLHNRIEECKKLINKLEKNVIYYEEMLYKKENNIELDSFYNDQSIEQIKKWINETLEKIEYQIDKLAFFQNCLDELGGIKYNKDNIKPGYLVKIRDTWGKIIKANNKTVEIEIIEGGAKGFVLKYPYAEIQETKIPENYTEIKKKIETIENPYNEGDILIINNIAGNKILYAFQVLKTTNKTITIQEIELNEQGKPIKNKFKNNSKPERKKIVKSKYSDYIGSYYNNWQLHIYSTNKEQTA